MENAYAYKHTKELQNKMVALYNLTTNKMAASYKKNYKTKWLSYTI